MIPPTHLPVSHSKLCLPSPILNCLTYWLWPILIQYIVLGRYCRVCIAMHRKDTMRLYHTDILQFIKSGHVITIQMKSCCMLAVYKRCLYPMLSTSDPPELPYPWKCPNLPHKVPPKAPNLNLSLCCDTHGCCPTIPMWGSSLHVWNLKRYSEESESDTSKKSESDKSKKG